tara:strand:+ start:3711 stop:4538 length:828 start_codon:yes stop_codon:yes gene_type:complete
MSLGFLRYAGVAVVPLAIAAHLVYSNLTDNDIPPPTFTSEATPQVGRRIMSQDEVNALLRRIEIGYNSMISDIEEEKQGLQARYNAAEPAELEGIVQESREFITAALVDNIFPFWMGTPWSFHGTAEVPFHGSIACGYFVSTTLEDVGFDLPRIGLAKEPALNIIKNLTPWEYINWYSNQKPEDVVKEIEKQGHGIYVVGLDNHVGFMVNDEEGMRFVHSSFFPPQAVSAQEPLDYFNPFKYSKVHAVGKILDDTLVEKWLRDERIPLTYRLERD